jgi:hypothetical protein
VATQQPLLKTNDDDRLKASLTQRLAAAPAMRKIAASFPVREPVRRNASRCNWSQ